MFHISDFPGSDFSLKKYANRLGCVQMTLPICALVRAMGGMFFTPPENVFKEGKRRRVREGCFKFDIANEYPDRT